MSVEPAARAIRSVSSSTGPRRPRSRRAPPPSRALGGQRLQERHVRNGHPAAGPQHARNFPPDLRLVGREVDDAIGDDRHPRWRPPTGRCSISPSRNSTLSEPGSLAVSRLLPRALASISGVMSTPIARPGRAHFAPGDEHVKPAATAQVQDHLAGFQSRQRRGIAARQPHIGPLGKSLKFFDGIAEFPGELVAVLG